MESFDLTAHSNRDDLLDSWGGVEPRVILLSHGEDGSRQWFTEQIHARYPKIKFLCPNRAKRWRSSLGFSHSP